jgi:hypothetical protein
MYDGMAEGDDAAGAYDSPVLVLAESLVALMSGQTLKPESQITTTNRFEFLRSQVTEHGWLGYPSRLVGAYVLRDGRESDNAMFDSMLDSRAEIRCTLSRMGAHPAALKMITVAEREYWSSPSVKTAKEVQQLQVPNVYFSTPYGRGGVGVGLYIHDFELGSELLRRSHRYRRHVMEVAPVPQGLVQSRGVNLAASELSQGVLSAEDVAMAHKLVKKTLESQFFAARHHRVNMDADRNRAKMNVIEVTKHMKEDQRTERKRRKAGNVHSNQGRWVNVRGQLVPREDVVIVVVTVQARIELETTLGIFYGTGLEMWFPMQNSFPDARLYAGRTLLCDSATFEWDRLSECPSTVLVMSAVVDEEYPIAQLVTHSNSGISRMDQCQPQCSGGEWRALVDVHNERVRANCQYLVVYPSSTTLAQVGPIVLTYDDEDERFVRSRCATAVQVVEDEISHLINFSLAHNQYQRKYPFKKARAFHKAAGELGSISLRDVATAMDCEEFAVWYLLVLRTGGSHLTSLLAPEEWLFVRSFLDDSITQQNLALSQLLDGAGRSFVTNLVFDTLLEYGGGVDVADLAYAYQFLLFSAFSAYFRTNLVEISKCA